MTATTMMMMALKGLAVTVAAAGAARLLREAPAAYRHRTWAAGLAALLVLAPVAGTGLEWRVPLPAVFPAAEEATPRLPPVPATVPETVVRAARVTDAPSLLRRAEVVPASRGRRDAGAERPPGTVATRPAVAASATPASGSGEAAVVPALPATEDGPTGPTSAGTARAASQPGDRRDGVGALSGTSAGSAEGASVDPGAALLSVWLAGAVLLLLGLLRGALRVRALLRSAEPAPQAVAGRARMLARRLGMRRAVRVCVHADVRVPLAAGLTRATVVLPPGHATWSDATLDHVLLHELAHHRRLDPAIHVLGEVARALHWPNPLAWVALGRLRAESELASDDTVLATGRSASGYAGDLVRIAREAGRGGVAAPAVAMARSGELGDRVRAILDPDRLRARAGLGGTLWTAGFAALLVLPLAALTPAPPEPPEPPRPPAAVEPPTAPAVQPLAALGDAAWTPAAALEALPTPPAPRPVGPVVRFADVGVALPAPAGVAAPALQVAIPGRATAQQSGSLCAWLGGDNVSSSMHVDDDEQRITWTSDRCRLDLDIRGRVDFAADESDVTALAPGGRFELEERSRDREMRVRVERARDGTLERTFWRDGRQAAWDADAQRWMAGALSQVFERTTLNAESRVRRFLEDGGVDGALARIERIDSDHVARRYVEILMGIQRLDEPQAARVMGMTARFESDHQKARLLMALAEDQGLGTRRLQEPFLAAAASIDSDHQKRQLLGKLLEQPGLGADQFDRIVLATSDIESDHQSAQLLIQIIEQGTLTGPGRASFLTALRSIESDHQRRQVLEAFLEAGSLAPEEASEVLRLVAEVGSDHQKTELLRGLARTRPEAPVLRRAYLDAAGSIGSDHQRRQAIQAFLGWRSPDPSEVADLLRLIRGMSSDHQKAELLASILSEQTLDAEGAGLFLDIAREMDSDHQLANTAEAVMESRAAEALSTDLVLALAARIDSDSRRAQVLAKLASAREITGEARERYLDLAEAIGSRTQRDRALAALVQRRDARR